MFKRTILSVVAFCWLVSCALCASPVGTWVGSYQFDAAKVKLPTDAKQKAMALQAIQILKNTKFIFVLKADKSFRMEIRSIQAGKPRLAVSEGKYTVSGNKVQTVTLKRDGKAVSVNDQTKNTLIVSADGKTMSHTKTDQMVNGHIELKRINK